MRGDTAAEREDWPAAVRAWDQALSGSRRDDAVARLEWFVARHTGQPVFKATPAWTSRRPEIFMAFLSCCLFAVAAVFLTEDLSHAASDVAMGAAWFFIVAAAVLALIYARYSDPEPVQAPRLGQRQVRALANQATALANGHVAASHRR